MRSKPTFDDAVRASVMLIATFAVAGYAYLFRSEAAVGALIGLLGLGASFLFRGRVQSTTHKVAGEAEL